MTRESRFAWGTGALLAVALTSMWSVGVGAQEDPPVVEHSVARLWNEQLLDAIRADRPKPPVHARNLFHLSVAMWDAWAAYDADAEGYIYQAKEIAPATAPEPVGPGHLITAVGSQSGSMMDLGMKGDSLEYDFGWSDEYDDDESSDEDPDEDPDDEGPADEVEVYIEAIEAARAEAISFAAYRLLQSRFPGTGFIDDGSGILNPCQPGALASLLEFDAQMDALGYDRLFTSTEGDSPAAVGNRIAAAVIAYGATDGANEGPHHCYPDDTGYSALNLTLPFKLPGTILFEPNHWQPLAFDLLILQNGIIIGVAEQKFVGVGWGDVKPFGLTPADLGTPNPVNCTPDPTAQSLPYFDPGCPPQLGGFGDATVKDSHLEVLRFESQLDPIEGVMIDISPGMLGNNPLGTDSGSGHPVNPFTGLPYPSNPANRADAYRVIAEFWADGPKSETPPGHWHTLANYITDHPQLGLKKIGGTGPTVNGLEWDVKLYLAVSGATHDAAVAAWGVKHYYDGNRPLPTIRYMCGLGQSSDPGGPSYHPDGIPLEPGLTEVITAASVLPGGKFEQIKSFCAGGGPATNTGLPCNSDADCPDDGLFNGFCDSSVGKIAVRAWNGSPAVPATQIGGVSWKRCIDWNTFQAKTFVTPPFPGYTSGHSTFSRSAAEVLTAFTGSPYFPGGLGTFTALQNEYLTFEEGPTETVELQWATYFDAADQAAISRRMGSIHAYYDDYPARIMASQIGNKALARALELFGPPQGGGTGGSQAILVEGTESGNGKSALVLGGETTGSSSTSAEPVTGGTPTHATERAQPERNDAPRRARLSDGKR